MLNPAPPPPALSFAVVILALVFVLGLIGIIATVEPWLAFAATLGLAVVCGFVALATRVG